MRRWLALTTAGVVAAGGCTPLTSRQPGKPVGQGSKPGNDAVSPNAPDVLAGFVVAPDGRKARDVSVEYTEASGADAGAPVEVRTDDTGYFRIERLSPNRMYRLTAKAAQDGVPLGGRAYAQTGVAQSQRVTIQLFENQTFSAAPQGDGGAGAGGMPKPADVPLPKPAATFGPHDLSIPGRASADPGPVDPLPVPSAPPGPPSLTATVPPAPGPAPGDLARQPPPLSGGVLQEPDRPAAADRAAAAGPPGARGDAGPVLAAARGHPAARRPAGRVAPPAGPPGERVRPRRRPRRRPRVPRRRPVGAARLHVVDVRAVREVRPGAERPAGPPRRQGRRGRRRPVR